MAIRIARIILVNLGLVFNLVGCGDLVTEDTDAVSTNGIDRDVTVTLENDAQSVDFGESVVLTWVTSGADSCLASGNWSGSRETSGTEIINLLTADSSFMLSCTGLGGEAVDTVNVTVNAPESIAVALSASPTSVSYYGSTTLSWSSSNAANCTATGDWTGAKALSGSQTINALTANSTFSLTCSGTGDDANDSVDVIVAAPLAPSVNLSASPSSVVQNGSTTLNWSTTNADSCTASGDWSGSKASAGLEIISGLTATSTFNISCSGPGGTISDSIVVTVTAPPTPTVSLSASPTSVTENGSSTLSWNTTNADTCTASGDWTGNKTVSGSESIPSISANSTFTLVCSGAGGSGSDAVSVTVVTVNNGTALLSWLPPTQNTDDSPLTDLAGFRIYYGTSSGNYSNTITLDNIGLTSYLVEDLAPATWYFTMTAFNSSGVESQYSVEGSKHIN